MPNVKLLIPTANKIETDELFEAFQNKFRISAKPYPINTIPFNFLVSMKGLDIYTIQSEMGSVQAGGSLITTTVAIEALDPDFIIMVGIAFGVNDKKHDYGDILISRQIASYECKRIGTEEKKWFQIFKKPRQIVINRSDKPHADPKLLRNCNNSLPHWGGVRVRIGLILSGEKLIDNIDYRDQITLQEPEALGGEMEGAGLYASCIEFNKPWLIIKSICDWANGKKKENEEEKQRSAAKNASEFLIHVINTFPPNTQKKRSRKGNIWGHPNIPKFLINRKDDINRIKEQIDDSNRSAINIVAFGGEGKTTLAFSLFNQFEKNNDDFEDYFWYSFYYKSQNIDDFLTKACDYFIPGFNKEDYPDIYQKSNLLIRHFQENQCFIVLDGLETILLINEDTPTRGTFENRAFRDFLYGFCSNPGRSKFLITSRCSLDELLETKNYHEMNLAQLKLDDIEEFFIKNEICGNPEEIEQICLKYGFHILTISLLITYLRMTKQKDISSLGNIKPFSTDLPQGKKLQSVLNEIWHHLSISSKYFMTRLSATRSGFPKKSISIVAFDNDGNKCGIDHPDFSKSLEILVNSQLISVIIDNEEIFFVSHPLIKTYFYSRMGVEEKKEIHIELMDYTKGIPFPKSIKTIDDAKSLLDHFYQCIRSESYIEAKACLEIDELFQKLRYWGYHDLALQELNPVIDKLFNSNGISEISYEDQLWFTITISVMLRSAGKPKRAIQILEKQREICKSNKDNKGELDCLLHTFRSLMHLGDLQKGLQYTKEAKELPHDSIKQHIFGSYGIFKARTGDLKGGIADMKKSLEICEEEIKDNRVKSAILFELGDTYLYQKDLDNAQSCFESSIKISEEEGCRDYGGHAIRGLGDCFLFKGHFKDSKSFYFLAKSISEDIGYKYLQAECEYGLANYYFLTSNSIEFEKHMKTLHRIICECDFSILLIKYLSLLDKKSEAENKSASNQNKISELINISGYKNI